MKLSQKMTIKTTLIAAAVAAAVVATPAGAQDVVPLHPALQDKFYIGAGAFFPRTTTSAQLTTPTGLGAAIDFEDALAMASSKTVPAFFGRWRFGERWRLEAEYFRLDRSGDTTIGRDIQWGDKFYPLGTRVQSRFDFADLRISAGYSFFRTKDKEFGVGLGLHMAAYDVSLTADGIGSEQQDVTAPLPVLSVYGQFALTDRWAVSARLDRFSLAYENYDGSLTSLGVDVMYQPFKHVGFGLGYRNLFIDAQVEKSGRMLSLKQTFQGPMLFMNASF